MEIGFPSIKTRKETIKERIDQFFSIKFKIYVLKFTINKSKGNNKYRKYVTYMKGKGYNFLYNSLPKDQ